MVKRAAIIILILSLLFISGCAEELQSPAPEAEEEISAAPSGGEESGIFGIAYFPSEPLNPYLCENSFNYLAVPLIYEGLFAVNESFGAEKGLCGDYKTENATEWVLTLREGAEFSDGTAVTAEDVVYSLGLASDCARYSERLKNIASADAGDDNTVIITLYEPNKNLPLLLDAPVIREGTGEEAAPPGSGRYVYRQSGEDYWLSAAREGLRERIYLITCAENDDVLYGFQTGLIDIVPYDALKTGGVSYGGDYERWDYDTGVMFFLGYNTLGGLLGDSRIRLALSRAIDREALAAEAFSHMARAACLPRYSDDHAPGGDSYSLEETAAALNELGFGDSDSDGVLDIGGENLSFTLLVNSESEAKVKAAEQIAAQLMETGAKLTVKAVSFDEYLDLLESGAFDIYLGEIRLTADFDTQKLWFSGGELNYGGFSDAELEALYSSADFPAAFEEKQPLSVLCFKKEALLVRRGEAGGLRPTQYDAFNNIEEWAFK